LFLNRPLTYSSLAELKTKLKLRDIHDWEQVAEKAQYRAIGMASLCGVSLRQLERHFLVTFGKSPQKWLKEIRLAKAAAILSQSRFLVKEAAALVGWDRAYFSREFKRVHGISPTKFRRNDILQVVRNGPTDRKSVFVAKSHTFAVVIRATP
jgi:transcriptional regulator GlxA family with amidase domain